MLADGAVLGVEQEEQREEQQEQQDEEGDDGNKDEEQQDEEGDDGDDDEEEARAGEEEAGAGAGAGEEAGAGAGAAEEVPPPPFTANPAAITLAPVDDLRQDDDVTDDSEAFPTFDQNENNPEYQAKLAELNKKWHTAGAGRRAKAKMQQAQRKIEGQIRRLKAEYGVVDQ